MFGDERASAKEINLFLMRLQGQGLSGFRDNETRDARAYVQSLHLRLLQNLITIGSQAQHQILAQSVNRFLRYRGGVCTCARAEGYPTNELRYSLCSSHGWGISARAHVRTALLYLRNGSDWPSDTRLTKWPQAYCTVGQLSLKTGIN